jgi:DNA-binding CsgD family transcriptional regulator/PAS domain-containing protein
MGRPDVDTVLDDIYAAAAEPQRWRHALEALGDRFGGAPIVIGLQPTSQRTIFAANGRLDDELLKVFLERYATPKTNPSLQYYFTRPAGEPFNFLKHYGASKFVRLDMYKDLYEPQKIWQRCDANILKDSAVVAPFAMMGSPGCEALTSQEIDELKFFFPHMARALRVTHRVVRQTNEDRAIRSTFDQLQTAVMLVAADGKIGFMNRSAEEIARTCDGIRVVGGHLKADSVADNVRLERLIAEACSRLTRGGGTMGISRPSGAPRYGIEVTSLSDSASPIRAAIFISDPRGAERNSVDQLVETFGLTTAEARVVQKIMEGASLGEASEQLDTSVNTVKTLLQRAFAKIGVRRQSELVRMVASTVPNIRRS